MTNNQHKQKLFNTVAAALETYRKDSHQAGRAAASTLLIAAQRAAVRELTNAGERNLRTVVRW